MLFSPDSQKAPWLLASASPRRLSLLKQQGLEPTVIAPELDETTVLSGLNDLPLAQQVERLAQAKLEAVLAQTPWPLHGYALAADTVVAFKKQALGKPRDEAEAFDMLKALQGASHSVISALALRHQGRVIAHSRETQVTFSPLTNEQIQLYIATGEPLDKAGAYGIQGKAMGFVESLTGCYSNVVGLSLPLLATMVTTLQKP